MNSRFRGAVGLVGRSSRRAPPKEQKRASRPLLVVALVLATLATWRIVRMAVAPMPAASVEELLNGFGEPPTDDNPSKALARGPSAEAIARARVALAKEPLDANAYVVLGLAAEHRGRDATAARLMRIAAAWWPRELRAQTWLLSHDLRAGDPRSAVARLDTIVRARPDTLDALTEALAPILRDPAAASALADRLADAPWRTRFIDIAVRQWREPDGLIALLDRLQRRPPGLSAAELRPFLTKLMITSRFEQAYLTWLHSLPPERLAKLSNLYNGSFRYPISNMPFDWQTPSVPATVVSVSGPADHRELTVGFLGGQIALPPIEHDLMLAPGSYRLTGRVAIDRLRAEHGVRWRLACLDEDGRVQGSSELFVGEAKQRDFAMDFAVPDTGCRVQSLGLILDGSSSAQRASGVIAFSDLAIQPN